MFLDPQILIINQGSEFQKIHDGIYIMSPPAFLY